MSRNIRLWLSACIVLAGAGCFPPTNPPDNNDGNNPQAGDVSSAALSFSGTINGLVSATSSTDQGDSSLSERKALNSLPSGVTAWFEDLTGARLLDANGEEYPVISIGLDGGVQFEGLPVGVDIVFNVDYNSDGQADLRTILNIPTTDSNNNGLLDEWVCDPLSTLVHAKILALLQEFGLDATTSDTSTSGLIGRVRSIYANLLADAGIEDEILVDELLAKTLAQLAELFDVRIPVFARRGVQMFEGNLRLSKASTRDEVVAAAAQVLLRGGFPIADDPGGIDLSTLGQLPNIQSYTFEEWQEMVTGETGEPPSVDAQGPTLYVNLLGEADRNQPNLHEGANNADSPLLSEHVLTQLADLFLAGKTIRVFDVYELAVDLESGLGARLAYFQPTGPMTPPAWVFQTAEGVGVDLDPDALFDQLDALDAANPDPASFAQNQAEIRSAIKDFLAPTAAPSFEQLFANILTDRIASIDALARQLRDARAHLPFSISGPAELFVLATADGFSNASAAAVTVDAISGPDGEIESVVYRPDGTGTHFVVLLPGTSQDHVVQLMHRRTGRLTHNSEGQPVQVSMDDEAVFASIDGQPFVDMFSASGEWWPGAPALQLPNPNFDPTQPASAENPPTFQAFVLVNGVGPDANPVRVNFTGEAATLHPMGTYYLLFTDRSHTENLFALIDQQGNIMRADPADADSTTLITPSFVTGLNLEPQSFSFVFGKSVPRPGFNPRSAPYYDDIDADNMQDSNEPVFDFRTFLANPADWRSTDVLRYYRRADNNGAFLASDVNWGAETPQLIDGISLTPRTLKPALNAFRFGRPGVSVDLLSAFSPPEFFNGTQSLTAETRVDPFSALALLNLVFEGVINVQATVDFDGPTGPAPAQMELIEAELFVAPVGDPLQLIVDGFKVRAAAP